MTRPDDRDAALEHLLRQTPLVPTMGAGGCLDAETLAAWVDDELRGAYLEAARRHAAECARCQAALAALVRLSTPPVAAPAPASRRWLAWLVPVAATAATLAVWWAIPHRTPGSLPVAVGQSAAVESRKSESSGSERRASDAARTAEPQPVPAAADGPVAAAAAPKPAERQERNDPARPDVALRDRLEAKAVGAAAEPASQSAAALPATVAPAGAAPPAAASTLREAGRAAQRLQAVTSVLILSPDAARRWRLAGSTIERSTDGGATWSPVFSAPGARLTAGSAPSASVCWVVGLGGTVLRSTDGVRFERVAFPEGADLSAIQAESLAVAHITTTDGRRFDTTDAGLTWVLR